jgi:hypothetical protein
VVEYSYYLSGHWKAHCTVCDRTQVYPSLSAAFTAGRIHARECGA